PRSGHPVKYLRADLVDVAGVKVEAVDDLPQCRHGFHRIAPLKRGEILAFLQDPDQALVALDQGALGIAHLNAHRVLHAVTLGSPPVPITIRSSCRRFAMSSNRGRLPFSTFLTPKRRPSWACDSDFASSARMRAALASSLPGISTSTSISSCRPSAV